jgi:ADP-heptose:LPS heptosyltransferase
MSVLEFIRYLAKQVVESGEFLLWCRYLGRPRYARQRAGHAGEVDPRSILVVQMGSIGDGVMTTPALRALRQRFPYAEIDVLAAPGAGSVLEGGADHNRVMRVSRKYWRKFFTDRKAFRRTRDSLRNIDRGTYDVCIDLVGTFDSALYTGMSGAGLTVGPAGRLRSGVFSRSSFSVYDITARPGEGHVIEGYLKLTGLLGCSDQDRIERVLITDEERKRAGDVLAANELGPKEYCVIHPGAKWPPKRWPEESFARLIGLIKGNLGLTPVLTGAGTDRELLNSIAAKSGQERVLVIDYLDIRTTAGIIGEALFFVGNDSGPAHIAAGVLTPAVVLFGPTSPRKSAPPGDHVVALRDRTSCMPCTLYYRRDRCERGRNDCLRKISPEKVFETICTLVDLIP